ncbi:hypothetical protein KMC49_gp20 [Ralstonia phage Firinga]|uniref:Uncharacterized protein n=2 Tax=Firingavirus firinga TaxID=2846043 RepID=A0A7G5B9W5_9CAUD|nr:hypothetical protein KMC49_gp20 [Ralstonia phage Firinga]QMV33088.1 hypothetical protein 18C_00020 [Ralstonia phage Firinga]QMV33318.1 hypothetical protein 12C_00008 [Ralstonia phage Hennie]
MLNQPFSPAQGQTQIVAVSATQTTIGVDKNAKQIRVLNANAFPVYVRCSDAGNPANAVAPVGGTAGDYPIGPNSSEVITKADTFGAVSLIADTGKSGNVYVTPGEGFQSAAA